jgi:hypothetical protein
MIHSPITIISKNAVTNFGHCYTQKVTTFKLFNVNISFILYQQEYLSKKNELVHILRVLVLLSRWLEFNSWASGNNLIGRVKLTLCYSSSFRSCIFKFNIIMKYNPSFSQEKWVQFTLFSKVGYNVLPSTQNKNQINLTICTINIIYLILFSY